MLTHRVVLPSKIVFEWPDRDAKSGFCYSTVIFPASVRPSALEPLANAVEKLAIAGSIPSARHHINALKNTSKFITVDEQPFPPENWDDFLYRHFIWTLTNSKQYSTRVGEWKDNERVYNELIKQSFIPRDALVPPSKVRGGCAEDAIPPLTQSKKPALVPNTLSQVLPKSILAASGLELDDDEYLEKLESKIKKANDTVFECLINHWQSMVDSHQIGQNLLDKVTESDYEAILKSQNFVINGKHLADVESPDGLSWFLRAVKYHALHTKGFNAITLKCMKKMPFFQDFIGIKTNYQKIKNAVYEAASDSPLPLDNQRAPNELIGRLIGFLSVKDCAVACSLLTIENPSFTSSSIINCDLYTQNGKSYLRARNGSSRLIFSVSKPRAGTRKISLLPDVSLEIVTHVIECTLDLRKRQKELGKKNWRKLFLIASKVKIGSESAISNRLSHGMGITVFQEYKDKLEAAGVNEDTFNLSTFRATQAVLDFMKNGSLKRVAELLNSSIAVVRKYYIPPWLQVRWTDRVLRNIQQMLITLATEGHAWQLESTDFDSKERLRTFIQKILKHLKRGDALSELIREKLGKYADENVTIEQPFREAELLVTLDSYYLAALYAYDDISNSDHQTENCLEESAVIPDAGISSLVSLIEATSALASEQLSAAETAVIDKMSGDSLSQFQKTHQEAIKLSQEYIRLFALTPPQIITS